MSLLRTTVLPFKAQAYLNNDFVQVTDKELKGKWSVVFFYPADFTFICPTELEDLADNYDTFLINPEGQIVVIELHNGNIGRDAKELLRKLEAAQYVAAHPGEVCPARWTPGAKTLKPGADLVGKI